MEDETIVGKLKILGIGFSRWVRKGLDNLFQMGMEPPGSYRAQEKKDHGFSERKSRSGDTAPDIKETPARENIKTTLKEQPEEHRVTQPVTRPKKTAAKPKSTLSREQIMERAYKILLDNPAGVTASGLAKQIGVKPQALPHPLKKLTREKGVVKAGDYYFPDKQASENENVRAKIKRSGLKDPDLDSRILNTVKNKPGMTLSEIAEAMNKTRQGIAKASKRLLDEGTLRKKQNKYYHG